MKTGYYLTMYNACEKAKAGVVKAVKGSTVAAALLDRIAQAKGGFDTWGETLKRDRRIADLLAELDLRIAATQKVMVDLGVSDICRRCDQEEGGSCCGAGIENTYSSVFLLMNLLLGATLPECRSMENSCLFLDRNGCTLKARDVLCINYLCAKITTQLSPEARFLLQDVSGEEMDTAFVLQEAIRKIINR
jgi:hypothetical protein